MTATLGQFAAYLVRVFMQIGGCRWIYFAYAERALKVSELLGNQIYGGSDCTKCIIYLNKLLFCTTHVVGLCPLLQMHKQNIFEHG